MMLFDVNVLIYAHREDAEEHEQYLRWVDGVINSDLTYGISELVLSGFLRIVTHPRIFITPSRLEDALIFANQLRDRPNCVRVSPGPRHWNIFQGLCRQVRARGVTVPDAYLAALAIETGSEWITADGGFGRFPGLRWRHPLR